MDREFEVIVFGATGFTGRLVAEYLAAYAPEEAPRWAMAGRSATKLAEVRDLIGAPADTPLVVVDADDRAALEAMARRTAVVLTTVGPYQLYGTPLVAACAATGTAYVDLNGEPVWARSMIDAYADQARASGARIVLSCGFDSIPFDLGVWSLQEKAIAERGHPVPRVRGRVRKMRGGVSGGTVASMKATVAAGLRDPRTFGAMARSFLLTPGFTGPRQPSGLIPHYDRAVDSWVAPFVMAPINTKNVHRTNFLLGEHYGADFVYDEMMMTPPPATMLKGLFARKPRRSGGGGGGGSDRRGGGKRRRGGLKPGMGPSLEQRERGFYDIVFVGEEAGAPLIEVVVTGQRDPGYGSTCRMIAESALCLARDVPAAGNGGFWTPGGLMAAPLRDRLEAKAGLSFSR